MLTADGASSGSIVWMASCADGSGMLPSAMKQLRLHEMLGL